MLNWQHPQPFVISVDVSAQAIDVLGHTNNASYLKWLEKASWLHAQTLGLGLEQYQTLQKAMVVVRHHIDYLAATFEGESLQVGTWIIQGKLKSVVQRNFQIIRSSDAKTILQCNTHYACIDLKTGSAVKIPAPWFKIYRAHALIV